jgi:hypothetical protein
LRPSSWPVITLEKQSIIARYFNIFQFHYHYQHALLTRCKFITPLTIQSTLSKCKCARTRQDLSDLSSLGSNLLARERRNCVTPPLLHEHDISFTLPDLPGSGMNNCCRGVRRRRRRRCERGECECNRGKNIAKGRSFCPENSGPRLISPLLTLSKAANLRAITLFGWELMIAARTFICCMRSLPDELKAAKMSGAPPKSIHVMRAINHAAPALFISDNNITDALSDRPFASGLTHWCVHLYKGARTALFALCTPSAFCMRVCAAGRFSMNSLDRFIIIRATLDAGEAN